MTGTRTGLEDARAVADAVLYEGYVLYPYRATSAKNQVRFQWGVLMPPDVVAADPSERSTQRTEVVVEAVGDLTVLVRSLQLQRRQVQARTARGYERVERLETSDTTHVRFDEAVECETSLVVPLGTDCEHVHTWDIDAGESVETLTDGGREVGRLVRTRESVRLEVRVRVERPRSPYGVCLVVVETANVTPPADDLGGARPDWLRRAAIAAHTLLAVDDGAFVSLLDPPRWASGYVAACHNDGTFPVLMGPDDDARTMLSSPIILYDHARVADESRSTFFDALEVDELLSLRTLTLSDDEKREMRGTDPRAAALLDEVESISPELWDRLHGTVRYVDAMTAPGPAGRPLMPPQATEGEEVPWWDPGADGSVDPETDTVEIGDVEVRRGQRVILRPGKRRADAFDMFLAGREATVAGVFRDVDEGVHLAVTVDDDPGAALKDSHGRYFYFAPDEVEPLGRGAIR